MREIAPCFGAQSISFPTEAYHSLYTVISIAIGEIPRQHLIDELGHGSRQSTTCGTRTTQLQISVTPWFKIRIESFDNSLLGCWADVTVQELIDYVIVKKRSWCTLRDGSTARLPTVRPEISTKSRNTSPMTNLSLSLSTDSPACLPLLNLGETLSWLIFSFDLDSWVTSSLTVSINVYTADWSFA